MKSNITTIDVPYRVVVSAQTSSSEQFPFIGNDVPFIMLPSQDIDQESKRIIAEHMRQFADTWIALANK